MQNPPVVTDVSLPAEASQNRKKDGLEFSSLAGSTLGNDSGHSGRQQHILSSVDDILPNAQLRKERDIETQSDELQKCTDQSLDLRPCESQEDHDDSTHLDEDTAIIPTKPAGHPEFDAAAQELQNNSHVNLNTETSADLASSSRRWSIQNFPSKLINVESGGVPEPTQVRMSRSGSMHYDDTLEKETEQAVQVGGVNFGALLAERVSCIDSIRWLGHHLPETVLAFLIDEIEFEEAEDGVVSEYGDESCLSIPPEISADNEDEEDFDDAASDDYAVFNRRDEDDASVSPDSMATTMHTGQQRYEEKCDASQNRVFSVASSGEPKFTSTRRRTSLPDGSRREFERERRHSIPTSTLRDPVREFEGSLPLLRRHASPGRCSQSYQALYPSPAIFEHDTFCNSCDASDQSSSSISVASESGSSMMLHQGSDDDDDDDEDSFFNDSDDEDLQNKARLRQHRFFKTQDSLRKLKVEDVESIGEAKHAESMELNEDFYFADRMPPATRHDCALLFVDISGFTKLSTILDVEPFSKTTNSFFQMIVEEIEAFGGDVLKFAGDALFAEWQASTSNPLETVDGVSVTSCTIASVSDPWHGLELEECVLTAAACAARIVDKCSEYPVYSSGQEATGPVVATLDVHCGLGFGEVVGVHVGDHQTRMEYLILGDPIEQVAKSMLLAGRGEVVVSPEALVMLEDVAELEEGIQKSGMEEPQIIATKTTRFFNPKGTLHVHKNWKITLDEMTTKPRQRLAERCEAWDLLALRRLRLRMSRYVHPVILNDEFSLKVYPGDRYRAQERHRSEAELRCVYTVFLMPLVSTRLTGDDEEDCRVIMLLNEIMLIMTRELARYKGQLRQFIVDDKGVVLIANFGLRGSTFPNMVSERALPFTTTVQTLLRTELDVECQMGATYGEAYCGVVGGVTRHEYAVLGPTVNLAARLMGNPINTGFLVDDAVREKAGSRQFRALTPVKAKGYAEPVPIFEPSLFCQRSWTDLKESFVGRENEQSLLQCLSRSLLDAGGPAKLALLAGESGAGKSALCMQVTAQIRETCVSKGVPHVVSRSICNEGDAFVPFSIVRPLFADILCSQQDLTQLDSDWVVSSEEIEAFLYGASTESDVAPSLVRLVHVCRQDNVPIRYVDIICRLILTRNRVDVIQSRNGASDNAELGTIARFIVSAYLRCTLFFDLVLFALDDISNIDQMSWVLIELLHTHAQNLMIIGTARTVTKEELHIQRDFWDKLHDEGLGQGSFVRIELPPMEQRDINTLIARRLGHEDSIVDPKLSREVYVQSGGMPHLASELLDQIMEKSARDLRLCDGDTELRASDKGMEIGNVGELVLHRMDALPSSVRSHLNLGAVLGSSFELMDVVTAFEQYRSVMREERFDHAKSVHESLQEAVVHGIIEEEQSNPEQTHARYKYTDNPYTEFSTTYRFTHNVWRSNILRLTLNEFKRDVHSLIAQSMETVMDTQVTSDYRVLTKLFSHWKESGSVRKASTLALKMGRSLEDIGLMHQSVLVYTEALDMWKAMTNDGGVEDALGGLSTQLVEQMEAADLECITTLNVSLGRCLSCILDPKGSASRFQTALNLIQRAPAANQLEDRSIIFPVFSGLFDALRFGQNDDFKYEVGLVQMFLRETQRCKDCSHHSRALAMQAEMFARHGKIALALEAVASLQMIYDVEQHSSVLTLTYGSDRSAQCIAQGSLWSKQAGRIDEALATCDLVLDHLLPKIEKCSLHNSFLTLYPMLWIMKDHGMALRARNVFDEYVVRRFGKLIDERAVTPDKPLHIPILALLELIGTSCTTEELKKYAEWVLVKKNGRFCSELNKYLGSLGRTADSVTAEICLILARRSEDRDEKTALIEKGLELATESLGLTGGEGEATGMRVAYEQLKPVYDELANLHSLLPPQRLSRRSSCGF